MSKHTKGSWEVLDFGDGPQVDADTGPVAVLVGFRKTRLANGRLIAAAPELLEAIKAMLRTAPAFLPDGADKWAIDDYATAIKAASEAIAKAEGKE